MTHGPMAPKELGSQQATLKSSRWIAARRLTSKASTGFSLTQLIVVVAIVGIMLGVAIPTYRSFVNNATLTTATNDFVAALNIARSEALKRDAIVSVQASDTSSKDFADGYCLVIGTPGNCTDAIRTFSVGSTTMEIMISGDLSVISFDGLGGLSGTSGANRQIDLCRGDQDYRKIEIKLIGRPTVSSGVECP